MKYRLGLDMGATSIGWALFDMDNHTVPNGGMGVRIFDDGREAKTYTPLCVKRRQARGARRLTHRREIRLQQLLRLLTSNALFPSDQAERNALKDTNPYTLRKEALDRPLSAHELGRVFMQLAKRRGFRSNRKDDKVQGKKLKAGYDELKKQMEEKGARTYGEYLYLCLKEKKAIRLKNCFDENGNFKEKVGDTRNTFPFREIYQEEFDEICKAQAPHHPKLQDSTFCSSIKDIIFKQLPLRTPEEGYCFFEPGEKRIPRAHPLFQEFRIWQTIVNLKYRTPNMKEMQSLSQAQRDTLCDLLLLRQPGKIKQLLKYEDIIKALDLPAETSFNFQKTSTTKTERDKGLFVDKTEWAMRQSENMKAYWETWTPEKKELLISVLFRPEQYIELPNTLSADKQDALIMNFIRQEFGISQPAAEEAYSMSLEDGTGRLSEKAIRKLLPYMKGGKTYAEACQACYPDSIGPTLDRLPYYGAILKQRCLGAKSNPQNDEEKYGRINNATVHIALNQVRHLVNEIIARWGKPYDIAIEYARDLPASTKEREKIAAEQKNNEQENEEIRAELQKKFQDRTITDDDIKKYKIWESMAINPEHRVCPYSGKIISIEDLFSDQKFQIEHVLPFARSFDDSRANKVIATIRANREKGNRTPWEAFHESPDESEYSWKKIQDRLKHMRPDLRWRFEEGAMERFKKRAGPIARSLNDTRYMSRILQEYLRPIVHPDGTKTVQAVAGALTALVRKSWGLNQYKDKDTDTDTDKNKNKNKDKNKDKTDPEAYRALHRHHAIDAYIVAAINRDQIGGASHAWKEIDSYVERMHVSELAQLTDPNVSEEKKKELRKTIGQTKAGRQAAIIKSYFSQQTNPQQILTQAENINISHKPSLKNVNQLHSTVGQLHEDTAYGLVKFTDETGLIALVRTKKKEKDKKSAESIQGQATETTDTSLATTTDKKSKEKNKNGKGIDITTYVPMFRNQDDKATYYDAYLKWFRVAGKAATMQAKKASEKALKKQMKQKELDAVQALRTAALKAFKWFVGGNNYCAEIYEINPKNKIQGIPTTNQGEWESEIVSNYNATVRHARGENICYWHQKYPNAKRIMTLRRNDMVMATFKRSEAESEKFYKGIRDYVLARFQKNPTLDEVNILFRVKKIQSNGQIGFTPHDIAKEDGDTKSLLIQASKMKRYHVRPVQVSYTGKVHDNAQNADNRAPIVSHTNGVPDAG